MDDNHSNGSRSEVKDIGTVEDGVRPVSTPSTSFEDGMWWEADDTKVRRKMDLHIVPLWVNLEDYVQA